MTGRSPEPVRWASWLPLAAAVLLGLAGCGRPAELVLQPAEWSFGTIPADSPVQQEITVANRGRRSTDVRLISTCACLTVDPAFVELSGGGAATVLVRYDPADDEGDISMQVIVRSGRGNGAGRLLLPVRGRVLSEGSADVRADADANPARSRPQLSFEYFYDPGCQGCEVFLVRQMIALQQELGIRLRVARHDVTRPETQRQYLEHLEGLGIEERAYPAVVFGDVVLQGDEEIKREFKKVLEGHLRQSSEGSSR